MDPLIIARDALEKCKSEVLDLEAQFQESRRKLPILSTDLKELENILDQKIKEATNDMTEAQKTVQMAYIISARDERNSKKLESEANQKLFDELRKSLIDKREECEQLQKKFDDVLNGL